MSTRLHILLWCTLLVAIALAASVVTTRVKVLATGSTVSHILAATKDPGTIADELYLATLSRHPNAVERDAAITYIRSGDMTRKTEDLQWALINRLEFLFN